VQCSSRRAAECCNMSMQAFTGKPNARMLVNCDYGR
jgi:hypothetical protein